MRHRFSALLFSLGMTSVGLGSVAQAQESPADVASKYGKFQVIYSKGDTCKVTYSSTVGEQKTTTLFTTECLSAYDSPGVSSPGLESKVGAVKFPFIATNGDEFHLFSISPSMGGNACYGTIYWAVVINGDKIWATKDSFSDCMETIESAKTTKTKGKVVVSFLSNEGTSYNVSMGRLETVVPKKKTRSVKSTTTLSVTGSIYPDGFGYTRYMPMLESGTKNYLIDQVGQCPLGNYEDDDQVQMTLEVKTWSDGVEELTCLSIQKK